MTTHRTPDPNTLDLLSWQPKAPVPVVPEGVRAATMRGRLCRMMAAAIRDSGKERGEIATAMSVYLGEPVSEHMLNAYVAEASDKSISTVRYLALVHATSDLRLLQVLVEPMGQVVVPARFEAAIRESQVRDRIKNLFAAGGSLEIPP